MLSANLLQSFQAVHARHLDIQQDHVRLVLRKPGQSLLPARGASRDQSAPGETQTQDFSGLNLIVHKENASSNHAGILLLP